MRFLRLLLIIPFINCAIASESADKDNSEKKKPEKKEVAIKVKSGKIARRFKPSKKPTIPLRRRTKKEEKEKPEPISTPTKRGQRPEPKKKVIPAHANRIYLINTTGSLETISWLDKTGKIILKESLPSEKESIDGNYVDAKQVFQVPDNASSIKFVYSQGNESNVVKLKNNQLYSLNCVPSKSSCLKLSIKEIGESKQKKKSAKEDKEKKAKESRTIYLTNNSDKNLYINWLSETGKSLGKNLIAARQKEKNYNYPENAIILKITYGDKISSKEKVFQKGELYEVNCRPTQSLCNEIIVEDRGLKDRIKTVETSETDSEKSGSTESEKEKPPKKRQLFPSSSAGIDTTSMTDVMDLTSFDYFKSGSTSSNDYSSDVSESSEDMSGYENEE